MSSTSHKPSFPNPKFPKFMQHSASSKFLQPELPSQLLSTLKKQLLIPASQIDQQIKQYQWRIKTELPIIKIIGFDILESYQGQTPIWVEMEDHPLRLSHLKELPLFKILYLLKESIIGFERLFDRVGSFQITPQMVAITQNNKCKVWLNQQFASNNFLKKFFTQKQFLLRIYAMFEVRANKLKATWTFFQTLKTIQTFCQALLFIQNYARDCKISLSNSCKINAHEKIEVSKNQEKSFDASLTMGRAPNFLKNNLKLTMNARNNGIVNMIQRKQREEQLKTKNPEMKASGDTAADLNTSNSNSFMKKDDSLIDSFMFKSSNPENKIKQTTSILPTIAQKKLLFTRQYSKDQGKNHSEIDNHCFTPTYASAKWQEEHRFTSTFNRKKFLGEEEDEQSDIDPQKINALFTTNNWKKNVGGLFQADSPLNSSFHEGKQVRKTKYEDSKLNLLGNFGKQLTQSHINEQFQNILN